MTLNPFTDDSVTRTLYSSPQRLDRRSSALYSAKIHGPGAVSTIVRLAETVVPAAATVLDIGCGQGQTTARLAERLATHRVIALDRSPALLAATTRRVGSVQAACADFHRLPLPEGCADLAVAAFCLYHSPCPDDAIAEITRTLVRGGTTILATKSADSYTEIDQLIAVSGLDPDAGRHPSLYSTFHADNAADICAGSLRVDRVVRQHHAFRFTDLHHLAVYVATSPKYRLPDELAGRPTWLAAALRSRVPDRPLVTTSTVAYIMGTKT